MSEPRVPLAFSLVQLQMFLAVLETGSATAAAGRLKVSQPAVSQQIRELERITHLALFRRHPHGLEPTDAALAIRPAALRAVAGASDAWAILADLLGLE